MRVVVSLAIGVAAVAWFGSGVVMLALLLILTVVGAIVALRALTAR
jgi:hypothetical protein